MSAKDSQFIERALVHPWMFWVFFWKWPRILRQVCGEYDLVAKDRDAAKAAHEQAVAANEKVRKWIHVTHQLDATADLRAIWTAGKRLSILLVFFVVTNAYGQAPPYLRNQWTTNLNPLALKVISTNGVHAATNVWELDFTNTATVTVSAVSNANKVMVSFTGSASSGSSSLTNALLHAGPTNGSVGALILTAGNGVTLTTSGTNRIAAIDTNVVAEISDLLWTNFTWIDLDGSTVYGVGLSNQLALAARIAVNYITNINGEPSSILAFGFRAGNTAGDTNSSASVHSFGDYAGYDQVAVRSYSVVNVGVDAGSQQILTNTIGIFNSGSSAGSSQRMTNTFVVSNFGGNSGSGQKLSSVNGLFNIGNNAGQNQVISNATQILNQGPQSGAAQIITGLDSGANVAATIWNVGRDAGNAQIIAQKSVDLINFGTSAGASRRLTNCVNIYAIGSSSGTNLVLTGVSNVMIFGNILASVPNAEEFWFGNSNNIYRFPGTGVITNVSHSPLAAGQIAITNGNMTSDRKFKSLQAGSNVTLTDEGTNIIIAASGTGGGIASIFTNNVLAGGPGLTELGFTNSPTVTVESTTNAGRVTVSFTSATGSGIATNSGTGWDTSIRSVSTNTVPLRVESEAGLRLTNFVQVATNGGVPFFVISSNKFVGIGTNSPRGEFHVMGSSGGQMKVADAGGGYIGITFWDSGSVNDYAFLGNSFSTANTFFNRPSGGEMHFREANGTSQVVIKSGGNVEIVGSTTFTGAITNSALTASKLVRTDATKKLVSSTLDESDIEGKQVGSEVLTNLTATKAFTNVTRTVITNVGVSLYTVPAGCKYIYVECVGGGGGGGGVDGAASQSAAGGGGGSGAYCTTNIVNPAASYIVTVGTNGLGGAAAAGVNNGTIGGTTLFTNILTALGGSGGSGDASAAAVGFAIGGAGALETATGYIYSGGSPGQHGICMSGTLAVSGGGAGSIFGGGGAPQTAAAGANATGKGAGGSGAAATTNVDRAGGNGSPGMIMIREYYQ